MNEIMFNNNRNLHIKILELFKEKSLHLNNKIVKLNIILVYLNIFCNQRSWVLYKLCFNIIRCFFNLISFVLNKIH